MTQASALRSFAMTAEFVARLIPKLAVAKAITKSEAELLVRQLKTGAEITLNIAAGTGAGTELAEPSGDNLILTPGQSLALRRMIEALKTDDSIYSACPDVVRGALADIFLPPYTSAEQQIRDLEEAREESLKLLERFGARIRELEQRRPLTAGKRTET